MSHQILRQTFFWNNEIFICVKNTAMKNISKDLSGRVKVYKDYYIVVLEVYYKLFSPIVLLKGLKVCNLYGHFSLFSWDLHGVTACLYCTWMSAGDFVAWGITFLNLSFSHARTKACRNVYQIRKHRVYFIAQWAATQWYQTMYNETFQMVYFY